MADVKNIMKHSQCVLPPALCSQIPSLQASAEDLPLALQRPDNFPLVVGILQEIYQENIVFTESMDFSSKTLNIGDVKQENAETEEHNVSVHSELCQEWSLKGVEELLTEPEEMHLRHDCSQQVQDVGLSHLQVYTVEEKPSITLQSWPHDCNWNGVQEAAPQVDVKPWIPQQLPISLQKGLLFGANVSSQVDKGPIVADVVPVQQPDVNKVNVNHLNDVMTLSQTHLGDKPNLHGIQGVKMESEEVEAYLPSYNEQTDALDGHTGKSEFMDLSQSVDKLSYLNFEHENFFSLSEQNLLPECSQSSDMELNVSMEQKSLSMYDTQRSTSAVLAFAANFSDLERSRIGEDHAFLPNLVAEASIYAPVASGNVELLAADIQLESVASTAAEAFCCTSNSSIPQDARFSLDVNESKPGAKPFSMHEMRDNQCQRNHPCDWQHARKNSGPQECPRVLVLDTMPVSTKRRIIFATDESAIMDENSVENSGKIDHCLDAKDAQSTGSQCKTKHSTPLASNHKTEENCSLSSEGTCGQSLQTMTQAKDRKGLLENQKSQSQASGRGKAKQPHLAMTKGQPEEAEKGSQCLKPQRKKKSLSQIAPQFSLPQTKKMRGTLSPDERKAAVLKKDTRCHRSDGKQWRCVRECINGAYYCQYHLRKRRIGYNRRKNNEVNVSDLEAMIDDA